MNMAFDQNVTHNLRWVIGNTMSVIADDSFLMISRGLSQIKPLDHLDKCMFYPLEK